MPTRSRAASGTTAWTPALATTRSTRAPATTTCAAGAGDDEIDQPGAASGLDDVADGSDLVDGGGDGFDTASYAGRTAPVDLLARRRRKRRPGGRADNLLAIDDIVGGQANDVLQGGPGDDTLTPGPGDDTVGGGAGEDAIDYSDRTLAVAITLGSGGSAGVAGEHDTIAADVEDATGGAGNDVITGDKRRQLSGGGAGDDVVTGGGGDDDLDPGDGADQLDGGAGRTPRTTPRSRTGSICRA